MRTTLLFLLLFLSQAALGDRVGYGGVKDIRVEGTQIAVLHHHDWSQATRDARWQMISITENPFTKENTYSYLRAIDKVSGELLFQEPVPALTYLWISSDSRFIVGASNIKVWNPIQLVVFTRSGQRIFEKRIRAEFWPGASEGVTNWISWYREPNPVITIKEEDGKMVLSIEGNAGEPRIFRFAIPK